MKVDLSRALARAYEKANVETLNQAAVLLAVAKNAQSVMSHGGSGNSGESGPSMTRQSSLRASRGSAFPLSPRSLASVMQSGAGGCSPDVAAKIRQTFPDADWWFQVVIPRESHCTLGAQNLREGCDSSGRTNSHAVGVVQICMPLHEDVFRAVGCTGAQWVNFDCYLKAWRRLYDGAGRAPWGG